MAFVREAMPKRAVISRGRGTPSRAASDSVGARRGLSACLIPALSEELASASGGK